MFVRTSLALSLVLCLAALAPAAETRTIELPRAGLSVDVPADWTVEQYGDALLELRSGESVLWIRTYDSPAPQEPVRFWGTKMGEGTEHLRCMARIGRDGVSVFEAEAHVPAETGKGAVDALLDSIDTTPYQYATRHVDWNDGWTLTLPEAWDRKSEARKGVVSFEAEDHSSRLWVEDLPGLMTFTGGSAEAERDLDAWADFAWKEGLKRLQEVEGVKSEAAPTIETLKVGDTEGRRMHLGLEPDADGKPQAWMHVLVLGGYRVLVTTRGTDDAGRAALQETLGSFRLGTHPGPRASAAKPTDRFPGDKGPAVVFALPEGWAVTAGTNSMRLAQVVVPDVEGVETVVFFFGVGGGGSIDGNLDRWRGQMQGDDEGTVETHEPAEGVKITLLDVTGAYASSQMNPHGRDPHGGGEEDRGDSRMLGAIVEVPGGPLFIKVIGPADVVADLKTAVTTWLLSFRPAS